MDQEIERLIKNAMDERNFRKQRSNGLLLSDNQIVILERNNIYWNQCGNYRDLVSEIELRLNDNFDSELDELSYQLQEQSYYLDTHK